MYNPRGHREICKWISGNQNVRTLQGVKVVCGSVLCQAWQLTTHNATPPQIKAEFNVRSAQDRPSVQIAMTMEWVIIYRDKQGIGSNPLLPKAHTRFICRERRPRLLHKLWRSR